MDEEYLFHYERFGFKFTVWRNRIEIQERRLIAWRSDTLLMRNISNVGVRLGGKLQLTLSDGKTREYVLGAEAEGARVTIIAQI